MPRPDCKKRVWSSELLLLILRCHLITMVQPAESRKGLNLASTRRANFCCTTCWRVLRESKMRPVLMVIEQVRRHQSFEMPLIEDDHVVQQVASATSHPALSNTVLPRTAKGRASWLASHVSQPKPPRRQTLRRGRRARICATVGRLWVIKMPSPIKIKRLERLCLVKIQSLRETA